MAASLSSTAARGILSMLTGQGMRIILQFVGVIVLARLLTPHDYGLITIVVVIIGVGEIFRDFGLSTAAVRSPDLSPGQSTNLFWVNSAIGVVLGCFLFIGAQPLAAAAGQPEVADIARALAAVFVLNGVATQFRALLMRNLHFTWLAAVDVISAAVALAVAITGSLIGWEYWALVAQQLVQALAILIGAALGARWFPGLPTKGASIRSFIRFGSNLVLSQVVNYVTNNTDTAIVGFVHGATALGLYNRASQVILMPLAQIQSPLTSVAVPVLSKIQDDHARFNAYLVRGQLALGYTISLALGIVIVAAEPITYLMLGSQWLAAVPLMQLFAAAGIARILAFVGYWVYVVRGLSGTLFRYTLVTGAIRVVCAVVGAQWGVIGVAGGLALAPWLAWPISLWWLSRVTVVPTRALYSGALRIITVSGVAVLVAFGVDTLLPTLAPVLSLLLTALVVAALAAVFCIIPTFRRDAAALWQVAGMMISKR